MFWCIETVILTPSSDVGESASKDYAFAPTLKKFPKNMGSVVLSNDTTITIKTAAI
jgi:hypothetical protein